MEFGAVYRLRDTKHGEFIVMTIGSSDGGMPISVLLINTEADTLKGYVFGKIGSWNVRYELDWERIDDHS